jgi:TonB family protein
VVQSIYFRGVSPELQQRVEDRLSIRAGNALGSFSRLQDELQQIDEHLTVSWIYDPQRTSVLLYIMLPFPPPPGTAAVPLPPGVFRIGGGVSAPLPTFRPEPEYSEQARRGKWQGAVLLQIVVDENGVPQDINVIRPLGMGLDQKAIEAVQKWRFKPGLKDGNPVPVAAVIEVNFRLAQSPETTATAAPASRPVAVGGAVMDSRVVQRVPPVYPANARAAGIQGTVQLSVTIGPDGRVQDVQTLSGPALLTQAATQAVAQWVYQPFLLNGQPVSVRTTANVNFALE